MTSQAPEPRLARDTTLKSAIFIGLDEATAALEESLRNLTDEQSWRRYAVRGRHCIGTVVMHALQNLNDHGVWFQGGQGVLGADERYDMWSHSPDELAPMQQAPPTVADLTALVRATREALFAVLEGTSHEQLLLARPEEPWFAEHGRTAADAYMRTVMHTMAHVRQIWFMRGVLGLTDQEGWPEQHWA